ncbi:MAG: hypothetical protein E7599_01800 [Ruminococcaceae bacterium]|nr:hypothetical protein [Oscillospiraceae bacterium]
MIHTSIRVTALLMAALICLCVLLTGCNQTKKNDVASDTKEDGVQSKPDWEENTEGSTTVPGESSTTAPGEGSTDENEDDKPQGGDLSRVPTLNVLVDALEMEQEQTLDISQYVETNDAEEIGFSVSDKTIISVNESGKLTAIGGGTAYVSVTARNSVGVVKKYIDVTVHKKLGPPQPPTPDIPEVTLFEKRATIDIGKQYDLMEMMFTLASEVLFTSDDWSVATVDEEGIITGVAVGETVINVYVVEGGVLYEGAKFPVKVGEKWEADDPVTKELLNLIDELPMYRGFTWFNCNILSTPKYNVRDLDKATAGPAEIWASTLQLNIRFERNTIDATVGIENMETYDFYFDFYYRPYSESNDRVDYKKAELQPWSVYNDLYNPIYRCRFYDAFGFGKGEGLVEGQLYQMFVVIRQGEKPLGYYETEMTWTDSCASYVEAAENDPTILK